MKKINININICSHKHLRDHNLTFNPNILCGFGTNDAFYSTLASSNPVYILYSARVLAAFEGSCRASLIINL